MSRSKLFKILRNPLPKPVIALWKQSLEQLLDIYDRRRGELTLFIPKLFAFFVALNISCYWLALLTAHPEELFSDEILEYILMQFPVGVLGAIFDTVSFFITVFIARRALKTTSTGRYIAHLSVDVIIAIVATWWVLFVFSVSGWVVSLVQQSPETFAHQASVYENRIVEAVQNPTDSRNLKNIYFGVVMGISAMLPTATHILLSLRAIAKYARKSAAAKRLRL